MATRSLTVLPPSAEVYKAEVAGSSPVVLLHNPKIYSGLWRCTLFLSKMKQGKGFLQKSLIYVYETPPDDVFKEVEGDLRMRCAVRA
jgi:hypothetical protein